MARGRKLATLRQVELLVPAIHQCDTQFFLQGRDAAGNRRLGDIEIFGRLREAFHAGNLDKGFDKA